MKKHIKSHSFKQAKFKSYDCDFVGLCECVVQDFVNLYINLNSFEVYQCGGCKKIFKTIKDVKNNIDEMEYTDGWHYVYHLKLDRSDDI